MQSGNGEIPPAYRRIVSLYGIIWLMNAVFLLCPWLLTSQHSATKHFLGLFARSTIHAPQLLKPLFVSIEAGVELLGPLNVAMFMATIATVIGLSLLFRFSVVFVSIFGFLYSLLLWLTIEGLGFPYTNGQTDPSVMPAYAICFIFIFAVSFRQKNITRNMNEKLWAVGRIAFGLLWLFDAILKWLPAFMFHFDSQITSQLPGQPSWIVAWLHLVLAIISFVGPTIFAIIIALVETAIALSLLTRFALPYMAPLAILYSLSVWFTAETFGGPYSLSGTGVRGNVIGNIIIYVIPLLMIFANIHSEQGSQKLFRNLKSLFHCERLTTGAQKHSSRRPTWSGD